MQTQLQDLDQQIQGLEDQQEKLVASEKQLSAKIESFRTQKEVIKAQYSAAEAQVKIGEAATGIGEQMADTGLAIQRAKDKTAQMQARAGAIDELVEAGRSTTSPPTQTDLDRELAQLSSKSQVDSELEAMKKELGSGRAGAPGGRQAGGADEMIVRLMGEGQYEVANDLHAALDAIDEHAGRGGRERRRARAAPAARGARGARPHERAAARRRGHPPSDLIVPPSDLSLAEARQLFKDERPDPGPARLAASPSPAHARSGRPSPGGVEVRPCLLGRCGYRSPVRAVDPRPRRPLEPFPEDASGPVVRGWPGP